MSTGICIVYPAWFLGSTDSTLHATAVFLGSTDTATFPRALVQDIVDHIEVAPGPVRVTGPALFGREKNVPVLTIESEVLQTQYDWILRELDYWDIAPSTEFGFNPHVTIAKEAAKPYFPHFIQLEAPVLWWGDDRAIHSKHKATVSA